MGHPSHHRAGSAAGAQGDGSEVVAEFIRLITAIVLVARAQSTVCTTTPALDRVVVEHRTCVGSTSTHRHCRAASPEWHRGEASTHFACTVTNVVFSAGAQAPRGTNTPTHHVIEIANHTGVRRPNTDCLGCAPSAKIHIRQRRAHLTSFITARIFISTAQATITASTPALHGTTRQQHTAVGVTSSNCHHTHTSTKPQRHCWQCIAHFAYTIAARVGVTQTKLAIVVETPTLDCIVVEHHAGVCGTRGKQFSSAARAQIHRWQAVAHRRRRATNIGGGPIAKSAIVAFTETFHTGVVKHRTRVQIAGRHRTHTATSTKADCCQGITHFASGVTECHGATRANLPSSVCAKALQLAPVEHHTGVCVTSVEIPGQCCDLSRRPIRLGRRRASRICNYAMHREDSRHCDDRRDDNECAVSC